MIRIENPSELSLVSNFGIVVFGLETVPPLPVSSGGILLFWFFILIYRQSKTDLGSHWHLSQIKWLSGRI